MNAITDRIKNEKLATGLVYIGCSVTYSGTGLEYQPTINGLINMYV